MATTTTVENLMADSIQTTDLQSGNLIVTGAARFANGIYGEINDATDINGATNTSTLSDSDYVFVSSGGHLKKISYANLVADLSTKVSVTFADSEGVAY